MDLSIVIPGYNEVENVAKLQHELTPIITQLATGQTVEVIFVDDGSTDGFGEALEGAFGQRDDLPFAFRLERHTVNRGLGAALRTGFAATKGDVVVTTDSDGTYPFAEIPALLSYLTPDVDMVTASPYHPTGAVQNVPRYRLLLSRGSSMIYRLLVDWHIHTYTALFRAYRRSVIECVPFESDGFLAGTEILVNGMRMGYRVAEYPTVLYSRVHGTSKAKIARTIKSHLKFQGHVLLRMLKLGPALEPQRTREG